MLKINCTTVTLNALNYQKWMQSQSLYYSKLIILNCGFIMLSDFSCKTYQNQLKKRKCYFVNRLCHFIKRGRFEITSTVPLKEKLTCKSSSRRLHSAYAQQKLLHRQGSSSSKIKLGLKNIKMNLQENLNFWAKLHN